MDSSNSAVIFGFRAWIEATFFSVHNYTNWKNASKHTKHNQAPRAGGNHMMAVPQRMQPYNL